MMKILAPIFWIIALLVAIVFYHDYLSRPAGYCGIENRRLSDKEIIMLAVQYEISHGNLKVDDADPSPANFILKNPDCCSVIRAEKRTLYEKLFHSDLQTMTTDFSVHLVYETNEMTLHPNDPSVRKFLGGYIDLDECGNFENRYLAGRRSLEAE